MTTKRHGEHQLELHVFDRSADRVRAVGQYGDFHRGGQRALELRQKSFYAVDHGDDIGAGLALNIDDDRRRLVRPGSELVVLDAVDHRGDIGEPHRRAVTVGDNRRSVLIARQQLIVGADRVGLMGAVEVAFGLIDVGLGDAGAQGFQGEAVGGQRRRVDLNTHGRLLPAADADQSDAGQLRNFLRQPGIREIFDIGQRQRL